jgi:hypothetical protein
MEKRNVVESGRTPATTEKTAEVVDAGAKLFKPVGVTNQTVRVLPEKKERTHANVTG